MEKPSARNDDLSLSDIMGRWPESLPVLMRYRMLCLGCAIAPFHNIHEACNEHQVDEDAFRDALDAAIARSVLTTGK